MSWTLLTALVLALGLALLVGLHRRAELARMARRVKERERTVRQGLSGAQLQYPVVDLSRCLGCATCVAVCPEGGVLEIVHGQAVVVNGARCQGISACERECPVGAIAVTVANLAERRDVPALTPDLEAAGSPGLFLAGEITAHSLIKTAVEHGTAVANRVARRVADEGANGALDLCIVGAGPAGLACSLEAKRLGLSFVTIDQAEGPGGTVAKYPRRKLVVTQPVDLPLHGRLDRRAYEKEELVELWERIAAEQELPLRGGEVFEGLERSERGTYLVRTQSGAIEAHNVCLAIGRRGTPRRLGVPGEDLPKVAYSLLDAGSYQGRRILVVGGGDSAVETALGLAEQPGNRVTLSYRKEAFFRIRQRSDERLAAAVEQGKLELLLRSEVRAIHPDSVELALHGPGMPPATVIPNDEVFVMAGGTPPFELLERAGVSFDPALRPPPEEIGEQGTGLLQALAAGFALALCALVWAVWHADYYALPAELRPSHAKHAFLRPGMGAGLWLGIAATALIAVNLAYLLRRSPRLRARAFKWGSLEHWMTSHVATGILAFLFATLHAAMNPRDTVGGRAYLALLVLLVTGAIGRYLYAWVPRAANGRELELEEVKLRLARMSEALEGGRKSFQEAARDEVLELIERRQWKGSFLGRLSALVGLRFDLREALARIERHGREQGVEPEQVAETLAIARRAHATALMAAHYEDLRAVLGTWRWLHRWVALLMVLLLALHVVYALTYGPYLEGLERLEGLGGGA
jgi:thioredoxin reductase/Pyruvate/2-oxoacid:ferredoxin oxidoreductase delta subunit